MVAGQAYQQARVAMLEHLRAHYTERLADVEGELRRLAAQSDEP